MSSMLLIIIQFNGFSAGIVEMLLFAVSICPFVGLSVHFGTNDDVYDSYKTAP